MEELDRSRAFAKDVKRIVVKVSYRETSAFSDFDLMRVVIVVVVARCSLLMWIGFSFILYKFKICDKCDNHIITIV